MKPSLTMMLTMIAGFATLALVVPLLLTFKACSIH